MKNLDVTMSGLPSGCADAYDAAREAKPVVCGHACKQYPTVLCTRAAHEGGHHQNDKDRLIWDDQISMRF